MKLFGKNETTNKPERLVLEAPWYTYCKKLQALFKLDPDIIVSDIEPLADADYQYVIGIEVKTHKKYKAITRLLSEKVNFGNINVRLDIYDEENGDPVFSDVELYETLFEGNPLVKDIRVTTDPTGTSHNFVRFQPEVIQFFTDNLQDYNGNWTGLAQDIARDIFPNETGVSFCTADIREKATMPLGEWP